jgi:hypothetical protein
MPGDRDGCTLAPDFDITDCVDIHDAAYAAQDAPRRDAGRALGSCVAQKRGWPLACLYWLGTRLFGWLWWRRVGRAYSA